MTYLLTTDPESGRAGIRCLRCGMTSWHPQDVRHRYCGNCHVFHDEAGEAAVPPADELAVTTISQWPELLAFAERMGERLRASGLVDFARETRDVTARGAWILLEERAHRLLGKIADGDPATDETPARATQAGRRRVADAAADVANQAMLVAYAWSRQAEEGGT